jgi:hypothetical protein
MSIYRAIVAHGPSRPIGIDGRAVWLRVYRDDEYLQYVVVVIAGIDLATRFAADAEGDGVELWSTAIHVAVGELRSAIDTGEIPLEKSDSAYRIEPDFNQINALLREPRGTLPMAAPGVEVWSEEW